MINGIEIDKNCSATMTDIDGDVMKFEAFPGEGMLTMTFIDDMGAEVAMNLDGIRLFQLRKMLDTFEYIIRHVKDD